MPDETKANTKGFILLFGNSSSFWISSKVGALSSDAFNPKGMPLDIIFHSTLFDRLLA
jgi:hypothetical protein